MTRFRSVLFMLIGGLAVVFFTACRPSYPSYSPSPGIESQGATNQYSFFGYSQVQYQQEKEKDATTNVPDYGQGAGDAQDASGETGFVFDF